MSAFHFGVRDVELTVEQVERHHAIARKHGTQFYYQGRVLGTPTTGWFSAESRGEPHNSRLALDVLADLRRAERRKRTHSRVKIPRTDFDPVQGRS